MRCALSVSAARDERSNMAARRVMLLHEQVENQKKGALCRYEAAARAARYAVYTRGARALTLVFARRQTREDIADAASV